jgi:phenylalanine-4-hydroxylase
MGNILQTPEDGLNQDHPGFTDELYLERRNLIAENGKGYKMGTPIPGFDYDENETGLWTTIWDTLYPKLMEHGCKEYKENFNKLIEAGLFKRESIPQLEDLNQFLQAQSNWRIKPVNGILSQREFLNCLAFRTFCCTQYIRHYSNPEYTPEPDIMHEFMGHVPMFADPAVCDISQLIGMLSLGATDQQVAMLGSIYWFTIEFGICLEDGQNKFYGAGVASSFGEIDNMISSNDIRELDLVNNPPPVEFVVQDVQPFYYRANSFKDVLHQLEDLSDSLYKPFKLTYDYSSNGYILDRAIIMEDQPTEIDGLAF